MFNLTEEVQRLQLLKHTKIYGLPYKRTHHNSNVIAKQSLPKVHYVDGIFYSTKAEQEHTFILRRFRNYSADFGRRLSKRKGQYHRPGGGYAGHTGRNV